MIEGQATKLGRTMHAIDYDTERDEIFVGNPLAAAVLVFRGEAEGNEAPLRVIQGPNTQLVYPHAVSVDSQNNEIIVGDLVGKAVVVFPVEASGNVRPVRAIKGPKTKLAFVYGVAVDPVRDLLVVSGKSTDGRGALFIFNRTDEGDVTPQAVISGLKTGIMEPWQVRLEPEQGKIFVSVVNFDFLPPYKLDEPREEFGVSKGTEEIAKPWSSDKPGFIGVWDITDSGNVPPKAVIKGLASGLIHPSGLATNAKNREIIVTDGARNGTFTFLVPEFFGRLER